MQNLSLAQLGAYFLDTYDEHVRDDDNLEMLENAAQAVTDEILRRVQDPAKIRALMDYHYKAWADSVQNPLSQDGRPMDRYYEFRVLAVVFEELAQRGALGR